MAKYRKKLEEVEAIQWTFKNGREINNLVGGNAYITHDLLWRSSNHEDGYTLHIPTLEKVVDVKIGDYVIKDENGKIYSCKKDIFEKTYEKVGEE